MRCSGNSGLTLVEALLVLAVIAAASAPVLTMYASSHRIASSAVRLTEATLHAQDLLEALAELSLEEFPPLDPGVATVLLSDSGPPAPSGGTRFDEVMRHFARQPMTAMERLVTAERLASGELFLKVEVSFENIAGEANTRQTLVLPMLATPRNWQ